MEEDQKPIVRSRGRPPKPKEKTGTLLMTEEEFKTYARSATPMLLARAIELAMASESPKEVLMVAQELANRGYGKVATGAEITVSDKIIAAWQELNKFKALPHVIEVDVDESPEAAD